MSELFDDSEEDLNEAEIFVNSEEEIDADICEHSILDARRRLEKMLEEKRLNDELRDELDDLVDY